MLLVGCHGSGHPPAPSLAQAVLGFVRQSQAAGGGRYVLPEPAAQEDLAAAVLQLSEGADSAAAGLAFGRGYTLRRLGDGAALLVPNPVADGRGWGAYAVRVGGLPVAIEVPHPRADLRTEDLGAELAERSQAAFVLIAGAGRDRAGGAADVAHAPGSLFTRVHAAVAAQGVPAVQVHGFAAASSAGNEVIVSPGAAPPGPLVRRVADRIEAGGFRTCRTWERDCGPLEGRTNAQSAVSAALGVPFVHLEVVHAVRQDPVRRAALVAVLADALRTGLTAPPE
ncbi:MAG: hypothetical protein JWL64_2247 [Frankiales bacterium]|nr:hypothetical protein [Frankiales bacterium]